MVWECSGAKCGECLSALTHTHAMCDYACSHIKKLRDATFSVSEQKIGLHIEYLLGTLLRTGRSTLQYVVAGVETCKKAWTWAHGFSMATVNRVHARFNRQWQDANPRETKMGKPRHIVGSQQTADMWIYRWLLLASHNPPNGTTASVPKVSAGVLYPQYLKWCQEANESPIVKGAFRGRLSVIKHDMDVATRSSKQGSAECAICSVLKRAKSQATSLAHKAEIGALLGEHIQFTNGEVKVYMDHAFEAKDNPQVRYLLKHLITVYIYIYSYICVYVSGFIPCNGWGRPICTRHSKGGG